MVEPFCAGLSATSSAYWMTFCNARMGFFRTTRCASKRGMPSGNFVAQFAAGTDKPATTPTSMPCQEYGQKRSDRTG